MIDQNENKTIDVEDKHYPPEFEEMLCYALSHEIAKRLCKDMEVTDEYRMQLVHDIANDTASSLRELRDPDNCPDPKDYPCRYKVMINRMFRDEGWNIVPFPEVDTPYERFKERLEENRRITFRVARVERRSRK